MSGNLIARDVIFASESTLSRITETYTFEGYFQVDPMMHLVTVVTFFEIFIKHIIENGKLSYQIVRLVTVRCNPNIQLAVKNKFKVDDVHPSKDKDSQIGHSIQHELGIQTKWKGISLFYFLYNVSSYYQTNCRTLLITPYFF